MKPAGLKVEEKYSLYLTYSESDLERKRDSFLKELRQPAGSLDRTFGSGPFTFRDNTWIQLEAIRRVLNGRKGGDAKFFSAINTQQSNGGGGGGAGAAGAAKALGFPVPHPLYSRSRGGNQQAVGAKLQAAAGNVGGRQNAVQAPTAFGSIGINKVKQQQQHQQHQQAGGGATLAGVLTRIPVPEREGKSGGGGLLSSDDAGFKSAPGRRNAGNQLNQAPEYGGGSGRATRKQKPLLPCDGCHKLSRDRRPSADLYMCPTCYQQIEKRPADDDSDDDFQPDKKAPAARAAAETTRGKGKRKAEGPPEVLEIPDDDEDALLARAVAASEAEAAAKKRPQRKTAQDAESLTTQLLGLKAFFPSPTDPEAVEVSAKDLSYLELGEFLNDTVIDMYLLKIKAGMTEAQRGRCHFFNTFFYKKLTEKDNAPRQTASERDAAKKAADAGGPAAKTDADLAFDRAYNRVKRWTKSIDLLAKDFIVVPIHKDLHWSLAIICHPGRTQPQAAAAAAAAVQQAKMVETVDLTVETQSPPVTAQAQEQQQEQQQPCPIILHLDSMAQGHKTVEVGKMLRAYLHREWQSRQARAEAVKAQAAPPPGVEGDLPALGMDVTDPASAAAFGVGDAAAGMVEPSFPEPAPPPLDFDAMECLRLQLPQQDNTTDCGCFLLAYVQYFAQALPVLVPGITGDMVQALKREKQRGEGVQLVIAGEESPCFLGKLWFHQGYGCHMRTLLRIEALQVLVDQGPKPQPGATAPAAAARDAGVAAGPDGAAGLGQDTDVAMVATPVVDKRVAHAAAELKRERDRAEMVEGRLEKEHREAIAKWRKKAQGGEAAEEVVAVEAGGGKGGRGKGKAAAAPAKGKTELAEVTLASDVEDDMPVGLISRGKAGASGKKAMAGAPVQAARARSGRAAAAAASRPGDNKGDSIIIEGDDEAGPRRCGRLRDKPPGMMAISPYVSDADVEEDQPPAKTGLKRLRKRSGDQARGAEEVDLTLDYDDEGGGEQPERKAAGQGKRKKYTSDDDDGSPRADASAFEMKPAAPAPEGGEEPQRQAHTPPVDVGGAPVCEDDAPPGFTAPAPPQVDHLDLTGDDDPPVDMGDRLDLVPSGRQHAAAARAGTNNKKKPNVGGVAAKR